MNRLIRLVILLAVVCLAGFWTSTALSSPHRDASAAAEDAIPFDVFASFKRIQQGNPIFACKPPEWAAAAHTIVVDDTIHYLWARREKSNYWVLMHSTAPVSDPATIKHDPRNPVLLPSKEGFDNFTIEYPFPFWNPADRKTWDCDGILTPHIFEAGDFYYMLYAGKKGKEWQTGLAKTPKP